MNIHDTVRIKRSKTTGVVESTHWKTPVYGYNGKYGPRRVQIATVRITAVCPVYAPYVDVGQSYEFSAQSLVRGQAEDKE